MKKYLRILLAAVLLIACGCTPHGNGNAPYEPDTPAPEPHAGIFTSEHGTMEFSGDGESIVIDFDEELSRLSGLPAGRQEGTYVFCSGNLPPHGSVPVRYDTAHELKIDVSGVSAVIVMGTVNTDGTASVGVNTVTPERIPMLFSTDGENLCIEFLKG